MIRILAVLFLLMWLPGCATTASHDWTRFSDGSLDEWLDKEAVPELAKTLTQHPRFKTETIRIAALEGEEVAGRSNGLTTAVRDKLHSDLLSEAGLNIVRVDGPENCTTASTSGYYLAVETSPSGSRGANVQLRLFDIVERQWVSGFGHQWRGDLSSAQRDALRRPVVAETARGSRVLPFTGDQSDLLAERLAAELACQLKHSGDDELIVKPVKDRSASLIAGNLASKHQIPVGANGELVLETRVHKVDERLYQVWAILTPATVSDEVSAIATSAYATGPLLRASTAKPRPPASAPAVVPVAVAKPKPEPTLLSRLSVIAAADCSDSQWRHKTRDLGDRPVIGPGECFGLEFESHPAAHVYVIRHQVDAGLTRLYPSRCVRDGLAGTSVRFPEKSKPLNWDARSGNETFYVIATRGQRATTRLERLVTQLPDGCRADKDSKPADTRWLNDIDSAMRSLDDDVAWEAVRVYHQPRDPTPRLGEI